MVHMLVRLQLLVRSTLEDVGCDFHQRDQNVILYHTCNIRLARIKTARMSEHTGDYKDYGRFAKLRE